MKRYVQVVANERRFREKGGIMIINERCRENNGGVAVDEKKKEVV